MCSLPCWSSFALTNAEKLLSPYGVSAMQCKSPVLALVLPIFLGCEGEQPCVFSTSHEFCVTGLLFHFCLSLFPGFWHKPLREIVGSGNNLKPYNLQYLKVPLSSEANSLPLDSVYELLLLFSPRIPFVVQANLCLMSTFSSPSGSWICMKLGSVGTLGWGGLT